MKPLSVIAIGLIIVLVDVPVRGFDVVTDIIGWLACFWGLLTMSRLGNWFGIGLAGAALGAGVSMFSSTAQNGTLAVLDVIATFLVMFGACSGLMQISRETDPGTASMSNAVRWTLVALLVLTPLSMKFLPQWSLVTLGYLGIAVVVWTLLLLFTRAGRSYAVPQRTRE